MQLLLASEDIHIICSQFLGPRPSLLMYKGSKLAGDLRFCLVQVPCSWLLKSRPLSEGSSPIYVPFETIRSQVLGIRTILLIFWRSELAESLRSCLAPDCSHERRSFSCQFTAAPIACYKGWRYGGPFFALHCTLVEASMRQLRTHEEKSTARSLIGIDAWHIPP